MSRLVLLSALVSTIALADIAPAEPSPAAPPAEAAPAPAAEVAPAPPVEAAPAPAPMHPAGIEKAGPSGVIEGGWGYVFAAYGLSFGGLALYALSLALRRQKPGAPS